MPADRSSGTGHARISYQPMVSTKGMRQTSSAAADAMLARLKRLYQPCRSQIRLSTFGARPKRSVVKRAARSARIVGVTFASDCA
jgi:hypothetical protein